MSQHSEGFGDRILEDLVQRVACVDSTVGEGRAIDDEDGVKGVAVRAEVGVVQVDLVPVSDESGLRQPIALGVEIEMRVGGGIGGRKVDMEVGGFGETLPTLRDLFDLLPRATEFDPGHLARIKRDSRSGRGGS